MTSEIQRLNDPNYAISLAVGPPFPELQPQSPGSGVVLSGRYSNEPRRVQPDTALRRALVAVYSGYYPPVWDAGLAVQLPSIHYFSDLFIFKKAHLSRDDYRIFDGTSGHVVAAMHHYGKNPYDAFDPLDQSNYGDSMLGEWDSVCSVSGYNGMPSLKIRPKTVSRHGRQNVYDGTGQRLLFNIGKESKLRNMALRSNLAVRLDDSKESVYRILPDLMGRTLQIHNTRDELVCFVQRSAKALILEAALGAGSEMLIDVAPGVDWTTMVAIVMAVQQVGAHFVKDALGNFVIDPLKGQAVQEVLQGTGMAGAGAEMGTSIDQAMMFMNKMQALHRMFAA